MEIKIIDKIKDEDFETMRQSDDERIAINLEDIEFLSSKEITKLLVLYNAGKKIELINTNTHIVETINALKIGEMVTISNER
ncbi:MAG: hypothetical protein KAT05_14505 [Spirochaetes bacterium]|nr:hypothetical protein [Spirochaetota bacterium]